MRKIYTNTGETNLIHSTNCNDKFELFFDMLSHFGITIWTDWARLGPAWALWGWGEGAELPSVYMYSVSTTTIPHIAVG